MEKSKQFYQGLHVGAIESAMIANSTPQPTTAKTHLFNYVNYFCVRCFRPFLWTGAGPNMAGKFDFTTIMGPSVGKDVSFDGAA